MAKGDVDYLLFLEREFAQEERVEPRAKVEAEIRDHRSRQVALNDAKRLIEPRSRYGPLFGVTRFDIKVARARLDGARQMSMTARTLKRSVDIIIATFVLVALAPVLLLICILIRLDSAGPPMIKQKRVDMFGEHFLMLSFRTRQVSERTRPSDVTRELVNIGWRVVSTRDSELTRVGRFLRRYSVEELPQLINVIKGDMSLIGPRPPLPVEVGHYSPGETLMVLVRPAMTGLWQISGGATLSWEHRQGLNEYYVENWNPLLDVMIFWRTLQYISRSSETDPR